MKKHAELVEEYDDEVDQLEVTFTEKGLTELQIEPFFFQLRTQLFFFTRLEDFSVDNSSLQEELFNHYNEQHSKIKEWLKDFKYALKYDNILAEVEIEPVEEPHEVTYLNGMMNNIGADNIQKNLAVALDALSEDQSEEIKDRFSAIKNRLLSIKEGDKSSIMDIIDRIERIICA